MESVNLLLLFIDRKVFKVKVKPNIVDFQPLNASSATKIKQVPDKNTKVRYKRLT